MSDITTLAQMGIVIVATVTPVIVLVRLIAGSQSVEDAARWTTAVAAWPVGVQEEDPLPWRFAGSSL